MISDLRFMIGSALLSALLAGMPAASSQQSEAAGAAPLLTPETFLHPPISVRPKYRWWLPLGATDDAELRREIKSMAEAGAGGVEVDALPVPGQVGASNVFLQQYGFGASLWSHHLETIFGAAAAQKFSVDLLVTPSWPATLPTVSHLNDPVAQQQLLAGYEEVQPGAIYSGPVPAPAKPAPEFLTQSCSEASPGDKQIEIAATSGFSPGEPVVLGQGSNSEQVIVDSASAPGPSVCALLPGDVAAGATRLQLATLPANLMPGTRFDIGSGIDRETVKVSAVETVSKHAEISFAPALTRAHSKGTEVSSSAGTLKLTTALTHAYPAGAPVTVKATRKLIAVLVARCSTAACAPEHGSRMLDANSVKDVTAMVGPDGQLHWTAPTGTEPWWIFSFNQVADGQLIPDLSDTTPNYVIDHLGPRGAEAVGSFYQATLLTPKLKTQIRTAGTSALFEDSFEPSSGLKWTWSFLNEFSRSRGYALNLLLPALAGTDVGARHPTFDFADTGERVREDYRQTWSDLYADAHMLEYRKWAHQVGLRTRMQVEGGPMEVADLAAIPDIPEGENRNFINNPELWKVIAVGAEMREHEAVLSDECCPISEGVWATTAGGKPYTVAQGTGKPFGGPGDNANLNWVYKAYAGGVSQLVWHGFPYIATPPGSGERSLWPGNSFDGNKSFSEAFGPRMPQWEDYRRINDHLARLQLVLRQGRPQYDLAVFWHDFGEPGIAPNFTAYTGYPGLSKMFTTTSSLDGAGFTYQYLSPSYLKDASPLAVQNGELFAHRMGFKGILLNQQEVMPIESLRRIRAIVRDAKFPLLVVGKVPSRVVGAAGAVSGDAEVDTIVKEWRSMAEKPGSNVVFLSQEAELPAALAKLGIRPSAEHLSNPGSSDILTVHRRSRQTDLYYLFNQGVEPVDQTLSLQGTGQPFELDTWTGRTVPLALYNAKPGRIEVPIKLGANDVKVIAISRSLQQEKVRATHAIHTNASAILWHADRLAVRNINPGRYETSLSDGHSCSTTVDTLPAPITLDAWRLQIESWTPDETNLPGLDHTRKAKLPELTAKAAANGALPSWTDLGQPDVAGFGYYSTTATLPSEWSTGNGAYLDLGEVVDTFRITINGTVVPPSSFQDTSQIDVGQYLHAGENRIEVRVATPLRNAVETAVKAGSTRMKTYGLIGPVRLKPYLDTPCTSPYQK